MKSANRLPHVLARLEAARAGVEEALLFNEGGWWMEFSAANVFAVMAGKLFTPSIHEGALPGITRGVVIELARTLGIPVDECGFERPFVEACDEIFATNSLIELTPVIELDNRPTPVGPITCRLQEAYRKLVEDELGI
jgi:branched-chain amino acid aminotransferase